MTATMNDFEIRERLIALERKVDRLFEHAGLSAEEAATVMGRRAGTVRGLTFRAIASLRRRMEPEEAKSR
jgi:DNA-directed RNA polymerase specialized sigma24 family protein